MSARGKNKRPYLFDCLIMFIIPGIRPGIFGKVHWVREPEKQVVQAY